MELTSLRPMAKRLTVQGWKTGACQTNCRLHCRSKILRLFWEGRKNASKTQSLFTCCLLSLL